MALGMALSIAHQNLATQAAPLGLANRAINILKSAGPGAWYDPSDLTTLFQDSAGTTPVTAVEQPVGLMLDKSKGLVLGSELVPSLDFATWDSGGGVSARTTNSFTTTTAGGLYLTPTGWSTAKAYRVRLIGTSSVAWNFRNTEGGNGLVAVASGAFDLTIQAVHVSQSTTFGQLYIQPTGAGTISFTTLSFKELPGNHLIQPTATSRPTLSSRYNLLTKTEQFDDGAWTKTRMTVTANATTAPDGTLTADKLVESVDNGQHYVLPGMVTYSATAYTISIYAKAAERSVLQFVSVTAFPSAYVNFDLSAGTVSAQSGVDSVSITSVGNGWYRCSFVDTATVAGSAYGFGISTQISPTAGLGDGYASDGTSGLFVWGASLTTAADASLPYQRINTATDYDYDFSKFPPFLRFDGVDDSMYTAASIDFTTTDKMTVFAGVHKASEVGTQTLLEMSPTKNSNTGVFAVFAPITGGGIDITWISKGTVEESAAAMVTSPTTRVFTGIGDIAGDNNTLRLNGVQWAQNTTDQGTGNYGNHVLYIGRRANASLPFNGRLYQLAIKGKALSAAEIATVESFVNSKTKAY